MRFLPLFLLVAIAGCLDVGSFMSGDEAADVPLRSVVDPYYDVAPPDRTYTEHGLSYLVAGATGDEEFGFHTFEEVEAKLADWERRYPHLVDVRVAGGSVQGRPIYHVIVTDESVPPTNKVAPLFEGGIHGNEYVGSEFMLFTVDFLLQNHATNRSVQRLLTEIDLHLLPIVNPDGYVGGLRTNADGVNLNRNFDVDWGNPRGTSNAVMGLVGEGADRPFGGIMIVAENCGPYANSEPETQAVHDVMASLEGRAAFHLAGHAPTNAVLTIPASAEPPFEVPPEHQEVLDAELDWIRHNTEYEAGRAQWGDFSAGIPYAASGNSMDYWYKMHERPAFTVETEFWFTSTTSDDYDERLREEYDGLRFWMDATLPIPMHLLTNAVELAEWKVPSRAPLLPDGWVREDLPPSAPSLHIH